MSEQEPRPQPLHTELRRIKGQLCEINTYDGGVINIVGPDTLDEATSPDVRSLIVEHMHRDDVTAIEYDLGNIVSMHAVGLGIMIGAKQRSKSCDKNFDIVNLNEKARTVLELARIIEFFESPQENPEQS